MTGQTSNTQIMFSISYCSPVMLPKVIYAYMPGSSKGIHYAKAPIIFNIWQQKLFLLTPLSCIGRTCFYLLQCSSSPPSPFCDPIPFQQIQNAIFEFMLCFIWWSFPLFPHAGQTGFAESMCPPSFCFLLFLL